MANLHSKSAQTQCFQPEYTTHQPWQEHLAGDIKDQLRQQIHAQITPQSRYLHELVQQTNNAVENMLHTSFEKNGLTAQLEELYSLYKYFYDEANIAKSWRTRRYINNTGLIISPDHCTHSIKDARRVYAFTRGIDAALKKLRQQNSKTLRVAYPACGPFAPFLLPLLSYYKHTQAYTPSDLQVTLIDIQQGAVESLQQLVNKLGIGEYIENIVCCDAVDFHSEKPFQLIVLEALQHGFSREGHMRLAKHFATLLDEKGIFLPQSIVVGAAVVDAQKEYVEQWQTTETTINPEPITREVPRVELGEILNVNLGMLRKMKTQQQDEFTQLYQCNAVDIPELSPSLKRQTLIIHTRIMVYENEQITEYQSGITHPLPDLQVCINFTPRDLKPGDLLVKSGDTLQFYYCLNGLPGFLPIALENPKNKSVLSAG